MPKDFERGEGAIYGLSGAVQIPVDAESVTAFVGPAPRGPVDRAVPVQDTESFEKQFGVPEYPCRMGFAIRQFFANGGRHAVVVRVSACTERNLIVLHGDTGDLCLEARNPGPLEFLRASVDYDSIPADETRCFNIVVQRLRTADSAWIDEQEYFRGVTTDPNSRDYIGRVLAQSELVRLHGTAPEERPALTIRRGSIRESGYVSALARTVSSPAPTDYDLVGSQESGTGISALEGIPDVAHLCLISGAPDAAIGPVALLAADQFCRAHQTLLIVDPPARWQSVDDVIHDQRRSDFSSPNTVTWFPCVRTNNASEQKVLASATGAVAAALAEVECTRGMQRVHDEPMIMPRGGLKLAQDVSAEETRRLLRAGINALIRRSALHLQLLGNVTEARYASVTAGFDDLHVRAEVLTIARRIRLGTRWAVAYEPSPRLWRELRNQVDEFLAALYARAMLAGDGATDSWFVKCDRTTNKGSNAPGDIAFLVGVALRKPGEYFVMRFHHHPAGCNVAELGWQPTMAAAEAQAI